MLLECPGCATDQTFVLGSSTLDAGKVERFHAHMIGPWYREAYDRHGEMTQHLHGCRRCGLIFVDPVLSDEETLEIACKANSIPLEFSEDWRPVTFIRQAPVWARAVRLPSLNSLLRPYLKRPLRVLDVGASGGEIAAGLETAPGSRIDLMQAGGRFAVGTKRDGVQYRQSSCFMKHLAGSGYCCDIVLAAHVLEHSDNPYRFLLDCLSVVEEGGVLVIEVPYEFDAAMQVATNDFFQMAHNVFFAPWSLRTLLARLPLAVEHFELLDNFHTGVGEMPYAVIRCLCRKTAVPQPPTHESVGNPLASMLDKLCQSFAGSLALEAGVKFKVFFYSPAYEPLARVFAQASGFCGFTTSNETLTHENIFRCDLSGLDFVLTLNQADREALRQNLKVPEGCLVH
jgi:2-polyprenyl-3-methyl-5-hydroxy-6-metoxy-1,4-benzoquinol methylase